MVEFGFGAKVFSQLRIGPYETALAVWGTVRIRGKITRRRYEFVGGSGKDKYRARRLASHRPPRDQFVTVRTEEFNRNPDKYSTFGDWLDIETESR
jgi:hypothetical protein